MTRLRAAALCLLLLLVPARADASLLDSFVCTLFGCAFTLDGSGTRLYLLYTQAPGSEVPPWGSAPPLRAVRAGTLDPVSLPAADQGSLLGIDTTGNGLDDVAVVDANSDGFMDAGDSLSSFGLDAVSNVVAADRGDRLHSFYFASAVPVDIYARVNGTTSSGEVGTGLDTSDIRYRSLVRASGVDAGFAYGGNSSTAGFTREPISRVSQFDPGPTRVIRFLSPTRSANGTVESQAVRITNQYRIRGYDLSHGTGSLHVDAEYLIYRP